jgi:1,4-alpha-glucan branching enzyme
METNTVQQKSPSSQVEQVVKFYFLSLNAKSVSVAGTFNNWTAGAITLKKDLSGAWRGSLRLKPGSYQYRFYVDGKWVSDPKASKTVPNEFGSSNAVLEIR